MMVLKTYAWDVMTFGDQLASLILELTKKWSAVLGHEIDPQAAVLLELSTYVDDTLGGGSPEEVAQFKGVRRPDGSYSGTLPAILSLVRLIPKVLMESGKTDPEILEQFGSKVLGHEWTLPSDKLIFRLAVNLSKKTRTGEREAPDLLRVDASRLHQMMFTKRRLLVWVMLLYNPMGLLTPILIKIKIELRRLFGGEHGELGWDDPIPVEAHRAWEILISESLTFPVITLPQSVRPAAGVSLPEPFALFDGSLEAYACCIYVRWLLASDNNDAPEYQVRQLTGKARVTPLKGSTAPRSELSGLLILSRLLKIVVEALWEKPSSVTLAGDSQCTIAALEKSGGLLAPYFANRVSEISRNLKEVSETVQVG